MWYSCNNSQPFRDDVITNKVAVSHHSNELTFRMCHAYGASTSEAHNKNHDYEAIPLKNFPPLPPAPPINPTSPVQMNDEYEISSISFDQEDNGQCEKSSKNSVQEDHDADATSYLTLLSTEKSSDNCEDNCEPTCAPSSIATPTKTTATPTITTPTALQQDEEYVKMQPVV